MPVVVNTNLEKIGSTKGTKYAHDGSIIEAAAPGGKVFIVSKEPEFIRDIAPYLVPSAMLIFAHILYMYSRNLCMAAWLVFLVAPLMNYILPQDCLNLSPKSEKAFFNDKRF